MKIETRQHTVKATDEKGETASLIAIVCFLLVALQLLVASPANAASLQLVPGSQWGSAGLNTRVEMKIYVPDNVVANPPVLVALHQCGGTGPFFFYDSQSNKSADQYGFIVVVPSTMDSDGNFGRCWDNGSPESLTRYGRADSEAVIRMVNYTLDTYHANPNRVYALGGSSGAMMVETMLGVYPEVFKAGVGFAGVTCGANGWGDDRNLNPQQWGDIVRAITPGYSGPYPRIQLWHGTADPIVSYKNLGNSAKQYSNLLGLNEIPTSTTEEHLLDVQSTFIHQVWQNACGDTLIDAYSEVGGGHGSDAWKPVFWVPFLGLDVVGPNDPIMPCDGGCNPTAITPYVQVKGGNWQQNASVTLTSGDQVTFGPQPVSSGAWSWSGCGTSGSSREQTISPTGSCTATATYTNNCGAESTQNFTVNVNQDPMPNPNPNPVPNPNPNPIPNPNPSAQAIENGRYNIVSSSSGLYLDVYGARTADGTDVIQYPGNGRANQQFDVEALGDGTYSIRAAHSGKAVEVSDGNANDGADLRQGTYTGGQNQRWRIEEVGDGVYSITSALSANKVLDVWEMNTTAGGEVKLYGWWGGSNQQWSFVKVGDAQNPNPNPVPNPNPNPNPNPVPGDTLPSAGCGKNPTLSSGEHTIRVNGQNRSFIVRVPDDYDSSHPYPLVFAFHWYGGTMQDVDGGGSSGYTWSYYGLREKADNSADHKMIFVAPQGVGNGWPNSGGQDLAFVDDMTAQIEENLCVDKSRLFSMGFSYGGGMTYALACDRADVFRGAAVYAGGQISGCSDGSKPVAYIGIHGIDDRIEGGRAARDTFVRNNGCTPQSPPEPNRGSLTHVCTSYNGCQDGYPVRWCAFDGGGHTPAPVDGTNSAYGGGDVTWTKSEVWDFFTQF